MQPIPFDALKQILVIRLDNIGDVVMLSPALRALHNACPSARITLMASPAGSQVAPLLPWVSSVITWRAVWQDIGENVPVVPEKEHELVHLLEEQSFDAAFIFTSFSQSPYPPAYACYLARIPVRVGQSNEFGGGLLTHWVRPLERNTYQVERNLHLLREVGIPAGSSQTELRIPPEEQARAGKILAELGLRQGQPYILLAPGASAAARRYDEQRFTEVARQLASQARLPVVLVGSQREMGKFPTLESLANDHAQVHSLIGKTVLGEMAEIIRRSALVIANNSGSMHFAAAFHRPMVILYSGTDTLDLWAPKTSAARFLFRDTQCTPCYGFQCPYQMECLDVPPEEIVNAALSLLKAEPSSPPGLTDPQAGIIQR